jgi:hypothetical protein
MRLSCESFNEGGARRRSIQEATMNIFKGLLFLHGYINPADYQAGLDDQIRRRFGAATAASEFVPPLGNHAAAQRAFGPPPRTAPVLEAGCVAGGCG